MQFQLVFNLLQRYKGKTKFFDLRSTSSYEHRHLPISIHINPEETRMSSLNLSKLTSEKELSRLRRYCIIIGYSEGFEECSEQLKEILLKIKCREIHMLGHLEDFLTRFSFLCEPLNRIQDFPNQIIPDFLYIGSQEHAHNREIIEILGITHILNATRAAANPFSGLKYCRVHVDDKETEKISNYFKKSYEFIDQALMGNAFGEKNVVLVHCAKGVSRSATLVIMYLMRAVGLNLEESLKFLKSHREIVEPNEGFIKELEEFDKNGHEFLPQDFTRRFSVN